jgi:hypothetical protein
MTAAVGQYTDFLTKKKASRWIISGSTTRPAFRSLDVGFIYKRFIERRAKLSKLLGKNDSQSSLQGQL